MPGGTGTKCASRVDKEDLMRYDVVEGKSISCEVEFIGRAGEDAHLAICFWRPKG